MWPQNRLHRCAVVNLSIAVAIEGQTKTLVEINGKEDGGQREGRKIQSRIGCVYAHQPQSWPRRAKFSHGERLRTGFTIHARRCRIQSVHYAAASSSKCLSYPCQPPTNANGMTLVLTHYSKSSFFVQKFNFDFPRKIVELFWVKTRETAAVLDILAVDNFDFTRKIVKKKFGWKTRKMLVICTY